MKTCKCVMYNLSDVLWGVTEQGKRERGDVEDMYSVVKEMRVDFSLAYRADACHRAESSCWELSFCSTKPQSSSKASFVMPTES